MSAEFTLRAMVRNYAVDNLWDKLDAKACLAAADELAAMRQKLEAAEKDADTREENMAAKALDYWVLLDEIKGDLSSTDGLISRGWIAMIIRKISNLDAAIAAGRKS